MRPLRTALGALALALAVTAPGRAARADAPAALAPGDPCFATLEAVKGFLGPWWDDAQHAAADQQYRERLQAGLQCCPELAEQVAQLRPPPDKSEVKFMETVDIPQEILANPSPCAQVLTHGGDPAAASPVDAWLQQQGEASYAAWERQYLSLDREFQACCAHRGTLDSLQACAAARDRLQAEYGQTLAERDSLQAAFRQAAPRPGRTALAAFPDGPGSGALALLGAAALLSGCLFGLPGRPPGRARLVSGGIGALLALLACLGAAALLPDTRLPDLLLALAAAVLLAACRLLLRCWVRIRRGQPAAPPP